MLNSSADNWTLQEDYSWVDINTYTYLSHMCQLTWSLSIQLSESEEIHIHIHTFGQELPVNLNHICEEAGEPTKEQGEPQLVHLKPGPSCSEDTSTPLLYSFVFKAHQPF